MNTENKREKFEFELSEPLNRYSLDNNSDTPDFILAKYLVGCLDAYACAIGMTQDWKTPPKNEEER